MMNSITFAVPRRPISFITQNTYLKQVLCFDEVIKKKVRSFSTSSLRVFVLDVKGVLNLRTGYCFCGWLARGEVFRRSCDGIMAKLNGEYNRLFLRILWQLRGLRRYSTPITINNPQQVNIAADGGQQLNTVNRGEGDG